MVVVMVVRGAASVVLAAVPASIRLPLLFFLLDPCQGPLSFIPHRALPLPLRRIGRFLLVVLL